MEDVAASQLYCGVRGELAGEADIAKVILVRQSALLTLRLKTRDAFGFQFDAREGMSTVFMHLLTRRNFCRDLDCWSPLRAKTTIAEEVSTKGLSVEGTLR